MSGAPELRWTVCSARMVSMKEAPITGLTGQEISYLPESPLPKGHAGYWREIGVRAGGSASKDAARLA
jgi:hypothetical protein